MSTPSSPLNHDRQMNFCGRDVEGWTLKCGLQPSMEVPDYAASLDLLCGVLLRTKERREGRAGDHGEDERCKNKVDSRENGREYRVENLSFVCFQSVGLIKGTQNSPKLRWGRLNSFCESSKPKFEDSR